MPRMVEDRPGDDPTSHAPKATEGEDGGALSMGHSCPPPPSGYACHVPLAGEDLKYGLSYGARSIYVLPMAVPYSSSSISRAPAPAFGVENDLGVNFVNFRA
jgi:hypothetical protein